MNETFLLKSANQKSRKSNVKQSGRFDLYKLERSEQTPYTHTHTHKMITVTLPYAPSVNYYLVASLCT